MDQTLHPLNESAAAEQMQAAVAMARQARATILAAAALLDDVVRLGRSSPLEARAIAFQSRLTDALPLTQED